MVEDDTFVDDEWRAGFFVSDKELTIEYDTGDTNPRTMSLEFRDEGERAVVEQVMQDPNFWVQIVNALSASLRKTSS